MNKLNYQGATAQPSSQQESGTPAQSRFNRPTHSHASRRSPLGAAILVLMLSLISGTRAADQVQLSTAQASLGTSEVFKTTDVQLELLRRNSGPNWAADHCFQLFVGSPYSKDEIYSTFDVLNQPVCESETPGVVIGRCSVQNAETLTFTFSSITTEASANQSIRIKLTNFRTPFSAQLLRTLNIRSYADSGCSRGLSTRQMPGITITQAALPNDKVSLDSTSKILGASTSSNTLKIKFTPPTTMNPGGDGSIDVRVPYWYKIGTTGEYSYNPTAENKCTSSCMRITSSSLLNDIIHMEYETMVADCISGKEIEINCRQYYNPLVPEKHVGYQVTVYDAEVDRRILFQSSDQLYVDATNYAAATIPKQNFIIDPSNSMIATDSTWTLSMAVNVPLNRDCYIKWQIPVEFSIDPIDIIASGIFMKDEFDSHLDIIDDLHFKQRKDHPELTRDEFNFKGCNVDSSLGKSPFGRIDISNIRTQTSMKDSGDISIKIYKDEAHTQLMAVLEDGVILKAENLTPGVLSEMAMAPADTRVQVVTTIQVNFRTEHELQEKAGVKVRLPFDTSIPDGKTELDVLMPDGSTQKGKVLPGNEVMVPNLVPAGQTLPAGSLTFVQIKGVKNQNSAKDAGDFEVTTMDFIDGDFWTVDFGHKDDSYIATVGKIVVVEPIKIDNPTNSATNAEYSIKFTLEDALPKSGYIQILIPETVVLDPPTTQSLGSCRIHFCSLVEAHKIEFLVQDGLTALTEHTLVIGGVTNPRSFKPSGNFLIYSLDIDGASHIDELQDAVTTAMTIAGAMEGFLAQQSNTTNGVVNKYTVDFQAVIPVLNTDKFTITFPIEMGVPATVEELDCQPVENFKPDGMSCSITDKTVTVLFLDFESATNAFGWTLSGIQNAASTKPSDLIDVYVRDQDGFVVSAYHEGPKVTNREPALIWKPNFDLVQSTKDHSAPATYTIWFIPVNPMPATGSIQITYPSQVDMLDGTRTKCKVTTDFGEFTQECKITPQSLQITIIGIFASNPGYQGKITIELENVKNPVTNQEGNGFVIMTYYDASQIYIQDKLLDRMMQPQFHCNYPCAECSVDNRDDCTVCWQKVDTQQDDPEYLMLYGTYGTDQDPSHNTCKAYCDAGFTTNGKDNKNCEKCDVSCKTCEDNGSAVIDAQTDERAGTGDKFRCTQCSETHVFRKAETKFCVAECELGYFASSENLCSLCDSPCKGCVDTRDKCTSCHQNDDHLDMSNPDEAKYANLHNLYIHQCVETCPDTFVSMNGFCRKCYSPCEKCTDRPENCATCIGTHEFLYQERCYNECPRGSALVSEKSICTPCPVGCDLCDPVDKTQCLKCTAPTVAFQGKCLDACPDGWHINWPESDGRACRPWKLGDAGVAPYPFLICALIFIIIILIGLVKKRAFLSHGKMTTESPQNTITCIIVAIGPLQFLATICQWICSIIYGTEIFAILAGVVTGLHIIINIAYFFTFKHNFDTGRLPMEYERRVRLGKMTRREASVHVTPVDDKFDAYKRANKSTVNTIYALMIMFNFKFNQFFYSFFYDLPYFKVHYSNVKYYRKMLTWYTIASIVAIDCSLIALDITCLTMIEDNNQLWTTVIETLILSLASFILGAIELYNIKKTLEYTEPKKNKLKVRNLEISDDDDWSDYADLDKKFDKERMTERRLLMDDLLKHVKHNKLLFLNNKLDELLNSFGNRKCKSMLDLGTGWPLEDDPRMAITWPCSPALREDYNEMGDVTFTAEDAYGMQGNNVYADVKSKFMGMDFGTQDDQGFREFQDALNRKHGGLMGQQEGDLEERRMKRKNRRRGRKNKYYAQIDHEDDQEAQIAEASDQEEHLQVIREQEEEEEQLRKAVQAEAAKQQAAAAQRKKDAEEASALKAAQEMADADLRKKKASELEKQSELEQRQEAKNAAEQAKRSKELQEEHMREKAKQEADAKKKQEELAKMSAANRAAYEKQEAERIKKEKEEQEKKKLADADAQKKQLEKDKQERAKAIEERERMQKERDASELNQNKAKAQQEDANRAQQKKDRTKDGNAHAKVEAGRGDALSPQLSEANQTIKMADTLMHEFNNGGDRPIDVPPRAELRTFNENDILGDLSRDENGNVVVPDDKNPKDKDGNPVNPRGYLVDPQTGAILENQNFQQMFSANELDERGEVPAPFNFEKYNFNPHNIMGDFDYNEGKPELMQSKQGFFMDKKGRRVNKHGWMVLANQGHLVDVSGRKKFDKQQLTNDGNLPKLLNYQGRRYDIKDVMGIFEKDSNSKIRPQKSSNKGLVDLLGRRVSEKGYLIDSQGNIIDSSQKVVFNKCDLKDGEFPKIFPFTKFNIKAIQGDFDLNATGQPVLSKHKNGGFQDKKTRIVNQKGYLIDQDGNVVDVRGRIVFDKVVLEKNGDIPPVFRTGVLKENTVDNVDDLITDFEKTMPVHGSTTDNAQRPTKRGQDEGETSMDSQMEDTPANYNQANQRFDGVGPDQDPGSYDEADDDYGMHHAANTGSDMEGGQSDPEARKGKKKKRKPKVTTVEVLQPTGREKNMAGAYGGQAVGSIRRPGVKYDKKRLEGSKTFRVNTAEEPKLRSKLQQLVKSASGAEAINELGQQQQPSNQGFMGQTVPQETIGKDTSRLSKGPDSQAAATQKQRRAGKGGQDFEEIFGKDIDQFLEDSEWDVRSDKDGQADPAARNTQKMKQLEKQMQGK